jgi:hypothetical protein
MLRMFFQRFQLVFASVLDAYFDCFICLQTNVGSVATQCFKSRSDVASTSSPSAVSHRCLLLLLLSVPAGHLLHLPLFSVLVTLGGRRGPRVDTWEKYYGRERLDAPSIRVLASPILE